MTSFWHKAAEQTQARCDVIQADFRAEPKGRRSIRRDPPPLPQALIPTGDPLLLRLAEELDYTRRMLDVMGDELASDGLIVTRHMTALQSVDIVGQILGHIASVIRSSDPPGAVDRIGMSDLKARLTRTKID
ncbi:MAG TPA: hypothetical protein VN640_02435 [Sphingomicrobium sp.]|jgi:hypothetical protein|nr:hypothetical protein [Sphingomicrobium sp.]